MLEENALTSGLRLIGNNFVFMHDNDPKHTSVLCKNYLRDAENEGTLQVMTWQSQSPDINLIELLWDALDRRIRRECPTTKDQLWTALQREWNNIFNIKVLIIFLMTLAKDMVRLSNNISTKIREKQGDITEDETVRFKSYLLSLGIDDPVTRDSYKSDNQYYKSLARQISDIIVEPISDVGGMMALTDVFCRVNRARGLELLSPEDLLNACRIMDSLDLPLKLYQFDSGVKVLQLQTLDNENVAYTTAELIEEKGSLTAEELARLVNISILLAKERLLVTETYGKCCRDDSIEGLRFYPNLFLTKEV